MKKHFVPLPIISLFIFSACEQNTPEYELTEEERKMFDTPFPQEQCLSYWNAAQGDILVYTSETDEVLNFYVSTKTSGYTPYVAYTEEQYENGEVSENEGREYFSFNATMQAQEDRTMTLTVSNQCSMRKSLNIMYRLINDNASQRGSMQVQTNQCTNDIFSVLTDTIQLLERANGETTGMLVRDKGLIWFTDADGMRWTLTGQAQGSPDGLTDAEREALNSPFPTDLFQAYFPYAEGTVLHYTSQAGGTLDMPIDNNYYSYTPYNYCSSEDGDANCENTEESFLMRSKATSSGGEWFYWSGRCDMRRNVQFYHMVRQGEVLSNGYFEYKTPQYTNDIFSALTDTIKLTDNNGATNGMIAKGKGLVWFKDMSGNEWELLEE